MNLQVQNSVEAEGTDCPELNIITQRQMEL